MNVEELTIIYGPMTAGKSTTLLTRAIEASYVYKVLFVNSLKDKRTDTSFSSHNPLFTDVLSCQKNIKTIKVKNIKDIPKEIIEWCDAIFIDEGQFFEDLCVILQIKKIINISGLLTDYKQQLFGDMYKLIPYADKIIKLSNYCNECIKNNKKPEQTLFTIKIEEYDNIGINENYKSVCRDCLYKIL